MDFVHPSRRALVPQPSHPTPSAPDRGRDRSDRDRQRRRRDDRESSRDRRRGNGDSADEARTQRRSPIRSPVPRSTSGRESPKYDDYVRRNSSPPLDRKSDDTRRRSISPSGGGESKRPEMTPENGRSWRQQENNMYRRDGGFEGGGDYFERYVVCFLLTRSFLIIVRKGAGNSVLTVPSPSGRNPLMPLLGSCTCFPNYCLSAMAHPVYLGHLSATRAREGSTNDVAPLLYLPRQRTAKKHGSAVSEKNASGGGKNEMGAESGTIGVRRATRATKPASVIVTAKQNRAGRRTAIIARHGRDPAATAHVANSPAAKTTGWRSPHPRVHLSPLYPVPPPLQAFHRHLRLAPSTRRWGMTVTRPERK